MTAVPGAVSSALGVIAMADRTGTARFAALADAVFAIAMTLLVLELKVPDLHGAAVARLGAELRAETGSYLAYALSFFIIGRAWFSHHRLDALITRVDDGLLRLNLLLLFFVAVLPFPTAVLGRYGARPPAIVPYAVCMIMMALLLTSIAWWAHNRRLLAEDADPHDVRAAVARPVATAAVFTVSIPLAFVSPTAAVYSWILTPLISRVGMRILDRVSKQRAA